LAGLACRSSGDWVEKVQPDGKVVLVVDLENIALSRIKISALKWMVARMAPRKYGAKVSLALAHQ
jgi:hypothetical protein